MIRLNLSDNNFESFDINRITPRHHLMIPTTPPISPGIRIGGYVTFGQNAVPIT